MLDRLTANSIIENINKSMIALKDMKGYKDYKDCKDCNVLKDTAMHALYVSVLLVAKELAFEELNPQVQIIVTEARNYLQNITV